MTTNIPIQTAAVAAGQVVVYQSNAVYPPSSLNKKAALTTGYMQIVLAIASVAFAIYYAQGWINSVSLWGAFGLYLVAGILGVIAGHLKRGNTCAIVGCMVMSILAAIAAFVHFTSHFFRTIIEHYDYDNDPFVVNILTTLTGVIEFVTAIVASAFMCRGTTCCCGKKTINANVLGQHPYAYYVDQPGQGVNQGQVAVQGYPMMQQQFVGQPIAMGQPQVMGQPQQNIQYTAQAHAQPPAYTEHETKEVPQMYTVV